MSHYAKIDSNNNVVQVIVADEEFFNSFIDSTPGKWLKASYNTRGGIHYAPNSNEPDGGVALRMNFPGIGYTYDSTRDAFVPPQPHLSWNLVEETCLWEAPIPHPEDEKDYYWNEETQAWDLIE